MMPFSSSEPYASISPIPSTYSTGSLGMPVSIMCFKGLSLHYEDIVKLLQHAPETQVIIDHFGFYFQGKGTWMTKFIQHHNKWWCVRITLISSLPSLMFPLFFVYLTGGDVDELAWSQLISLAAFPQVRTCIPSNYANLSPSGSYHNSGNEGLIQICITWNTVLVINFLARISNQVYSVNSIG